MTKRPGIIQSETVKSVLELRGINLDLLIKLKTALEKDPEEIAAASSEIADDDEVNEIIEVLDNVIEALEDVVINDMGLSKAQLAETEKEDDDEGEF